MKFVLSNPLLPITCLNLLYGRLPLVSHPPNPAEACSPYIHAMMHATCFYDRAASESPDTVAAATVSAVKSGRFLCSTTNGPVPVSLLALQRGLTPPPSILWTLLEVLLLPFLRLFSMVVGKSLEHEVRAIHAKFFPPKV